MKKLLPGFSLFLIATLPVINAFASYITQPVEMKYQPPRSSVKAALHGYEDQPVILKGKITNKLGPRHYELTDKSGTMLIEIGDDDTRVISASLQVGVMVEILGKINLKAGRPTLNAGRVEITG